MSKQGITLKIGLVFALDEEMAGFKRVMRETRSAFRSSDQMVTWYMGCLQVIALTGGIGRQRCAQATKQIIDQGATSVISAGFAAALDVRAHVGDVYIANRVKAYPENNCTPVSSNPGLMSLISPSQRANFVIRYSDLVTTDRVIIHSQEKHCIFRETGAAALDMESYAAARVCQEHGIPFLAIKSISDTAYQDLPIEILTLLSMNDWLGRALLVMAKPKLWLPLMRLRGQSRTAAENLGECLGMMLLRLI